MDPTDATHRAVPGVLGALTEALGPELVREQLRQVIDPELGVNIVDLGLIYEIAVDPDGLITVEMTLTTAGCPLGGFLDDEIRISLTALPQVRDVRVAMLWDPPWAPEAMSDTAKEQLGWR